MYVHILGVDKTQIWQNYKLRHYANFTFWTQSAVLMRNFTFYFDSFSTDWTWWGHISFFFSRDVQAGPQYTDRAGQGPIREGRWDGPQSTDGK